jgi:formylglycine-generating enzyme required for sulfatase activity
MGSPDGEGDESERPAHEVSIGAFCMQKTEVTVDAYEACIGAGACTTPHRAADKPDLFCNPGKAIDCGHLFCNAGKPGRGNHPIKCVEWSQASAFCKWTGGRLPTESEWEYAARGTAGRKFPWGEEAPTAKLLNACGDECLANLKAKGLPTLAAAMYAMYPGDDGFPETAPVGSFPAGASPFGVLDMAGNVLEWTESVYCPYANLNCSSAFRVIRGGEWLSNVANEVRAAGRFPARALGYHDNHLGFRCAR